MENLVLDSPSDEEEVIADAIEEAASAAAALLAVVADDEDEIQADPDKDAEFDFGEDDEPAAAAQEDKEVVDGAELDFGDDAAGAVDGAAKGAADDAAGGGNRGVADVGDLADLGDTEDFGIFGAGADVGDDEVIGSFDLTSQSKADVWAGSSSGAGAANGGTKDAEQPEASSWGKSEEADAAASSSPAAAEAGGAAGPSGPAKTESSSAQGEIQAESKAGSSVIGGGEPSLADVVEAPAARAATSSTGGMKLAPLSASGATLSPLSGMKLQPLGGGGTFGAAGGSTFGAGGGSTFGAGGGSTFGATGGSMFGAAASPLGAAKFDPQPAGSPSKPAASIEGDSQPAADKALQPVDSGFGLGAELAAGNASSGFGLEAERAAGSVSGAAESSFGADKAEVPAPSAASVSGPGKSGNSSAMFDPLPAGGATGAAANSFTGSQFDPLSAGSASGAAANSFSGANFDPLSAGSASGAAVNSFSGAKGDLPMGNTPGAAATSFSGSKFDPLGAGSTFGAAAASASGAKADAPPAGSVPGAAATSFSGSKFDPLGAGSTFGAAAASASGAKADTPPAGSVSGAAVNSFSGSKFDPLGAGSTFGATAASASDAKAVAPAAGSVTANGFGSSKFDALSAGSVSGAAAASASGAKPDAPAASSSNGVKAAPSTITGAVVNKAMLGARAKGVSLRTPSALELAQAQGQAESSGISPGVSLAILLELLERMKAYNLDPETATCEEVMNKVIVPDIEAQDDPASRDQNYSDFVRAIDPALVGRPNFYVSHAWSMPFSGIVHDVQNYVHMALADKMEQNPEDPDAWQDQVFVWMDMLCRKRKQGAAEAVAETRHAIAWAKGPTLQCVDDDLTVFRLAWIQYEAWCTADVKGADALRLLCPHVFTSGHVKQVMSNLDPSSAKCPDPKHYHAILKELRDRQALQQFRPTMVQVLLQAAYTEVQEWSSYEGYEVYLACALHKCGAFAQASSPDLLDDAMGLYKMASEMMKKSAENDPSGAIKGLAISNTIGEIEVLMDQRSWAEAERKLNVSLIMQLEALGEEHPDTMRTQRLLGQVLKKQKKWGEAESIYRQLVERYVRVYKEGSTMHSLGLLQLAELLFKTQALPESRRLAEQALAIQQRRAGAGADTPCRILEFLKKLAKRAGDREAWLKYRAQLKELGGGAQDTAQDAVPTD